VLLDKTGTLTFGTPQIREVVSANGFGERQIIAAASIAERKSEHPLAKAVMARAAELALTLVEPDEFEVYVTRGGKFLEPSELLTFCGQRQKMPLPPCDKWV
jgi:cation transport ATPase